MCAICESLTACEQLICMHTLYIRIQYSMSLWTKLGIEQSAYNYQTMIGPVLVSVQDLVVSVNGRLYND